MNRKELVDKCKEFGIKGISSKNKKELLLLVENYKIKKYTLNNNIIPQLSIVLKELLIKTSKKPTQLSIVLTELLNKTTRDKIRKVCKKCNELGHIASSVLCKVNIDTNNKLITKIKTYILSKNCLENKSIDDYCNELSVSLNITPSLCKSLYLKIPPKELLDRDIDVDIYIENIKDLIKKCNECNKNILCIQSNSHRLCGDNIICDVCWAKDEDERNLIWKQIKKYKSIQCEICDSVQINPLERYQYDHINMFDKNKSIYSMVQDGTHINDIYTEIDKCQILCLPCHHLVTDIESKLGYTRIKQILTKQLNQCEITKEEHDIEIKIYQKNYEYKMQYIYEELKVKYKTLIQSNYNRSMLNKYFLNYLF